MVVCLLLLELLLSLKPLSLEEGKVVSDIR